MRIAFEPYVGWFNSLPEELQQEVAVYIVHVWPSHPLEENIGESDLPLKLMNWILSYSGEKFKAVGITLAVIRITEFAFISRRGTHEDWDLSWDRSTEESDRQKEAGDKVFAESLERLQLSIPDRAEAWINAALAWHKLRASVLSDDALHYCLLPKAA